MYVACRGSSLLSAVSDVPVALSICWAVFSGVLLSPGQRPVNTCHLCAAAAVISVPAAHKGVCRSYKH